MADVENESSLTDILGKLRGQGHTNQTFINEDIVSVEITEIETDIKVQWQNGEISSEPSINLTPALHINEHDFRYVYFYIYNAQRCQKTGRL